MKREVGNSLWGGSPALLVPYRQWTRERLPNGNQGFVCCGDDGFFRAFDHRDPNDIGSVCVSEWKTFGRSIDRATEKTLAAVNLGRISGTLQIALVGGNVPGALSHYPRPILVAGDELPEQPVVASQILVTDYYRHRGSSVDEDELVSIIKKAAGYPAIGGDAA
jgi:hypothetical protein